jgi:hypothetical protein
LQDPLSGIRRKDNVCEGNLPGVVIGDTNDAGVRDVGVFQQMALEFSRGDLKTADLQNLLHT